MIPPTRALRIFSTNFESNDMFWIALCLLLIAAILLLANPFYRTHETDNAQQLEDLHAAMQRTEIELQAKTISKDEAETRRHDIAKRIIAIEDAPNMHALTKADRTIFMTLAIVVIMGAFGLYAVLGSPQMRIAKPKSIVDLSTPMQSPAQTLQSAITELEAHLEKNPDDAKNWQLLGWSYAKMERFAAAKTAYERALQLTPDNIDTLSSYGETLLFLSGGTVDEATLHIFEKALQIEPNDPRANFYKGLAKQQAGNEAEAFAIWVRLLKTAPKDAKWRTSLTAQIREWAIKLGRDIPIEAQLPIQRGPSATDIKAAQELTPKQREQMIQGMLVQLETRLKDQPDDLAGWQQLIRSHLVLKQTKQANTILAQARKALAKHPAKLKQINEFAKASGLKS